mmetsp:Transcript_8890/g.20394  ORF Transcript_8890/g.20394 Transcript_8890/m.20394 type:complete len:241 (+) Transcript_8890:378-1100(+)
MLLDEASTGDPRLLKVDMDESQISSASKSSPFKLCGDHKFVPVGRIEFEGLAPHLNRLFRAGEPCHGCVPADGSCGDNDAGLGESSSLPLVRAGGRRLTETFGAGSLIAAHVGVTWIEPRRLMGLGPLVTRGWSCRSIGPSRPGGDKLGILSLQGRKTIQEQMRVVFADPFLLLGDQPFGPRRASCTATECSLFFPATLSILLLISIRRDLVSPWWTWWSPASALNFQQDRNCPRRYPPF